VAYELFKRTSIRVDTPILAIGPGGRIRINAAGCRLLAEAGVKTVVILWDKAANRMAVKAAPKGEKNSFAVSFAGGHNSGTIVVKSFLSHIGWNATKTELLPTTWNAAEKMFEATLPPSCFSSGTAEVKRKNRFI
jgi:hypothetical protein